MKTKQTKAISETPEYKNVMAVMTLLTAALVLYARFKAAERA